MSECQQKGHATFLARQVLYVRDRRGVDHAVMEFGPAGPPRDPYWTCGLFGFSRFGHLAHQASPIQRLAVSRDGSVVVFEVTDDFSLVSQNQVLRGGAPATHRHASGELAAGVPR